MTDETDHLQDGTERPTCAECSDEATRVANAPGVRPNPRETPYCEEHAPNGADKI
jgi:hypothetical protein